MGRAILHFVEQFFSGRGAFANLQFQKDTRRRPMGLQHQVAPPNLYPLFFVPIGILFEKTFEFINFGLILRCL